MSDKREMRNLRKMEWLNYKFRFNNNFFFSIPPVIPYQSPLHFKSNPSQRSHNQSRLGRQDLFGSPTTMADKTVMGAGWRYSGDLKRWVCAPRISSSSVTLDRPLSLATLNCLHDLGNFNLLNHPVRHESIMRELSALDCDVIGLNEVMGASLWRRASRSRSKSSANHTYRPPLPHRPGDVDATQHHS